MVSNQSLTQSCKEKENSLSLITSLVTSLIFTVPQISMKNQRSLRESSVGRPLKAMSLVIWIKPGFNLKLLKFMVVLTISGWVLGKDGLKVLLYSLWLLLYHLFGLSLLFFSFCLKVLSISKSRGKRLITLVLVHHRTSTK